MHDEKKLTIKQRKFINEYIKDGNGTQAALKAYNTEDEKTASVIAAENLAKPSIRKRVDQALIALDITPEYVLGGFKSIAERSRVDMARARALENIGSIADLYPRANNSLELTNEGLTIKWQD